MTEPIPSPLTLQTLGTIKKMEVVVLEPTHVDSGSEAEYQRIFAAVSQAGAKALL